MSAYGPLAEKVRSLRKAAEMTQSELAERAGLSFAVIQTLERGAADPRRKTLVAVANALGVAVSELLGEAASLQDSTPPSKGSLSPDFALNPTAEDLVTILAEFLKVSPGRRSFAMSILFDDSSLAKEADRQAMLPSVASPPAAKQS